jgi:hypothetical protein
MWMAPIRNHKILQVQRTQQRTNHKRILMIQQAIQWSFKIQEIYIKKLTIVSG